MKNKILLYINILMILITFPVFFCVFFIGNNMDYYSGDKITTIYSSMVLFLLSLVALTVTLFLFSRFKNIVLNKKIIE